MRIWGKSNTATIVWWVRQIDSSLLLLLYFYKRSTESPLGCLFVYTIQWNEWNEKHNWMTNWGIGNDRCRCCSFPKMFSVRFLVLIFKLQDEQVIKFHGVLVLDASTVTIHILSQQKWSFRAAFTVRERTSIGHISQCAHEQCRRPEEKKTNLFVSLMCMLNVCAATAIDCTGNFYWWHIYV